MITYTCPRCGRTGSAADHLAGAMVACGHCNETIDLPAKIDDSSASTDPLIDLTAGPRKTTTHACQHCGQTLLTARELLRGQTCSRCGKKLRAQKRAARPKSDGMLRFSCGGCNKRLKAPANAAGKRATCVHCGRQMRVPRPPSVGSNPSIA